MILLRIRHTRRVISAAVLAVMTAASLLVCLPVSAAAAESHCPASSAPAQSGHCNMPASAMDCCVDGEQSPALPAAPQGATLDAPSSHLVPQAGTVLLFPGRTSFLSLRAAPPHGYRHVDLPTLNATFLI